MDDILHADEPKPHLIRRNRGDWLAIAPKGAVFSIGITAPSADEAVEKFSSVYKLWVSLFAKKDLTYPNSGDMTIP